MPASSRKLQRIMIQSYDEDVTDVNAEASRVRPDPNEPMNTVTGTEPERLLN